MSGRRVNRAGRVPLEELIRVACTPDPIEPVVRPRRTGLAPGVAMALGVLLILLSLVLAARSVLAAHGADAAEAASASASPTSEASGAPGHGLAPVDPASDPADGQARPGQVVVHVAGAVASPGVVTLDEGARVADAIDAAGGLAQEADPDQLNLARPLTDGEQVRVPRVGEDASAWQGTSGQAGASAGGGGGGQAPGAAGPAPSGSVNLNTADAAELETLPGIGPALAQRIIDYRAEHGAFTSVDELTSVSGIGSARLEALRDLVSV